MTKISIPNIMIMMRYLCDNHYITIFLPELVHKGVLWEDEFILNEWYVLILDFRIGDMGR